MKQAPKILNTLTQSQKLIWTGQKLEPDIPLYNIVFTFELFGKIDVSRFQKAFQILVDKCDSMRTVYESKNENPLRKILKTLDYKVELVDFSTQENPREKFEFWLNERIKTNFDLSKPLFDSALIKISEKRFIWYLNQHHINCDAWSVSVQYKALASIYSQLSNEVSLGDFKIPEFQKYAEFEQTSHQNLQNSSVEKYWNEKLKSIPQKPSLYGKKTSDGLTDSNRISLEIGSERAKKLIKIASEENIRSLTSQITLFNMFATVFFAYIYRISSQNIFAVGTPNHNRFNAELKNTPGLFIEILPILTNVKSSDSFLTLLKRVNLETINFLKNAKTGSGNVELSKSFNVILNYITASFPKFDGIECETKWLHAGHIDSNHHLRLEVYDFSENGNFTLDFDINNSIIPKHLQEETVGHFLKLLDGFIDNKEQSINSVEILSEVESERLLDFGNGTKEIKTDGKTILDLFHQSVEDFGDKQAVQFEDKSISYKELDERSNQLANKLIRLGVKKGSKVGLFLERSIDLIIGIFGILKAGGVYVPLDAIYPQERLNFIIEDADISALIVQNDLKEKLPKNDCILINFEDISNELSETPKIDIEPANLAYVIYTSGSTGTPKGATNKHENVVHLVNKLNNSIYSRYEDLLNVALIAPSIFDASIQQIFGAVLQGHSLHIAPECVRFDGNQLLKFFNEFEIDISDGTPAHLRLLLQTAKTSNLPKHFIIGGEAMSSKLVKKFQNKFKNNDFIITNIYGVAECSVDSIAYDISHDDEVEGSFVPIGKPLKDERIYILNEANQLQPIGTLGEICIGGLSVGGGYLNLGELSSEKFIDNPFISNEKIFKTGDLGYFLPDGNVQYLGRKDKQVNVNGYRVELGEIEKRLLSFKKNRPILQFPTLSQSFKRRCKNCVLSDSFPKINFDSEGICNVCRDFKSIEEKTTKFFKTQVDFESLLKQARQQKNSKYDCMLLYSGGKDSSYVLYKLVKMGLNVLAFTFDNGFISKAAFDNIKRQTSKLGVDCIIEKTDRMDEIFVESLNSDNTVCSGCFKSLTAISTKIAQDKGINVIVTGLSRGQIYETKLEGLFEEKVFDVPKIEERLLQFRRMFHIADDRTNRILDVDLSEIAFEKIYFLDFFRYDNTSVSEIREYLKEQDEYWQKPKDTGFCSSNCMMNDIGICVHSSEAGFHNYEAPLSWDIRLGISSREEVLPEVESKVDEKRVNRVLNKIGYYSKEIKDAVIIARKDDDGYESLVAYFVANQQLTVDEIRNHLFKYLPKYMIPKYFIQLEKLPLTTNGKIDKNSLPIPDLTRPTLETKFVAPNTEIEELVAEVWSEILQVKKVGIYDNFLNLGGNSLDSIRVMTRLNNKLDLDLPLNLVFEKPTVSQLSKEIETVILKMLKELDS